MFIRLILAVLFVMVMTPLAWAQEPLFAIEGRSSYLFPSSDSPGEELSIGGGPGVGMALTLGWRDQALEFSFDWTKVRLKNGYLDGELVMIPIMFSGFFRWHPRGQRWFPYLGAGFGSVILGFDPTDRFETLQIDFTDTVALQVVSGFEYFIMRGITLSFSVRYLYSRGYVRVEDALADPVVTTNKINLDKIAMGLGLKKYF